MNRIMLLEENKELKKQLEKKYEKVGTLTAEILYEENTRLVNEITVLKTENQQLKKNNQSMQEEMDRTWAKLQQKEDIINKAKEYIENNPLYDIDVYEYSICLNGIDDEQTRKELLEILDNKGE